MSDRDAIRLFLEGQRDAALAALAVLNEAPPPPVPDPTPAPGPAPVGRQPIFAWVGDWQLDVDGDGAWMIPDERLAQMAEVLGGLVVMSTPSGVVRPEVLELISRAMGAGLEVRVGCHYVNHSEAAVASFLNSWPGFSAIDCEPYPPSDQTWWFQDRPYYEMGKALGAVAPDLILYPSSNLSWPGSYNDQALEENGQPGVYEGNGGGPFIDGLLGAGARVTHSDAVFHHGPQRRGFTWEDGFADTVARARARFPSARMQASVMLWPDNTERSEVFEPGDIAEAFEAATRICTGPVVLYQGSLHTGDRDYPWSELLERLRF